MISLNVEKFDSSYILPTVSIDNTFVDLLLYIMAVERHWNLDCIDYAHCVVKFLWQLLRLYLTDQRRPAV
jgi:hypothetical protein